MARNPNYPAHPVNQPLSGPTNSHSSTSEAFGATLLEVVSNYADKLQKVEGRLYLTGISEGAREQVVRTGKFSPTGPVQAYDATSVIWESTREAVADARTWLVSKSEDSSRDDA